jgi:plastocyanin
MTTVSAPTRGRSGGRIGHAARVLLVAGAVLVGGTVVASAARALGGEVTIAERAFSPATLTVQVGEPVTWTNASGATHTVTSDVGTELDSGAIGPGEAYGHVFETPGTFAYHCAIHASMRGTITVIASPVSSGPGGSAEPTPPAGTLPPDFSPFPPAESAAPTGAASSASAPVPSPGATPSPASWGGILDAFVPVVVLGGLGAVAALAIARRRRPGR